MLLKRLGHETEVSAWLRGYSQIQDPAYRVWALEHPDPESLQNVDRILEIYSGARGIEEREQSRRTDGPDVLASISGHEWHMIHNMLSRRELGLDDFHRLLVWSRSSESRSFRSVLFVQSIAHALEQKWIQTLS